jgi:hypothetical protein
MTVHGVVTESHRQSCLSRMLDIRGMIVAVRRSTQGMDNATALALIVVFTLIFLCLLPLYITFDLTSTWEFTTTIRAGAAPVIDGVTPRAQTLLGITLGDLLIGVVLTSFTLLPTLVELAFPSIDHPVVNMAVHWSLSFDYISDWPTSWATTGYWADNPVVRFIYTVLFNLFVSVGVQALLVICVTVILFCVLTIIRGGPSRPHVVINQ